MTLLRGHSLRFLVTDYIDNELSTMEVHGHECLNDCNNGEY